MQSETIELNCVLATMDGLLAKNGCHQGAFLRLAQSNSQLCGNQIFECRANGFE